MKFSIYSDYDAIPDECRSVLVGGAFSPRPDVMVLGETVPMAALQRIVEPGVIVFARRDGATKLLYCSPDPEYLSGACVCGRGVSDGPGTSKCACGALVTATDEGQFVQSLLQLWSVLNDDELLLQPEFQVTPIGDGRIRIVAWNASRLISARDFRFAANVSTTWASRFVARAGAQRHPSGRYFPVSISYLYKYMANKGKRGRKQFSHVPTRSGWYIWGLDEEDWDEDEE